MASRKAKSIPKAIQARLAACRRAMKKLGATGFLVVNPADFIYLAGFTGDESAMLVTTRDLVLVTDRRFETQISSECPWATVDLRREALMPAVARVCKSLKLRKLAVQAEHLTLGDHDTLRGQARGLKTVSATGLLPGLRTIKSAEEVTAVRKAIRVAEEAFRKMRDTIRVGQTELEMAARLEFEMKSLGSSAPAFPTICAEGPHAALPHAHPGRRKVRRGSAILFDWGARVGGYHSDLTRMVFVGSIPRQLGEVYRIVLDAQQAAIAAIQPGKRTRDIDAVARKVISDAGFADAFSHNLGHGLGLAVHEAPLLGGRSEETLVEGMLVTVEPGVYLPGVGGIRIEDGVLVTGRGCRVLSRLERSLQGSVL